MTSEDKLRKRLFQHVLDERLLFVLSLATMILMSLLLGSFINVARSDPSVFENYGTAEWAALAFVLSFMVWTIYKSAAKAAELIEHRNQEGLIDAE